jgi:hypothetical protein
LFRFSFENFNSALTNFEVQIGGKIYKGECKDSKVAKQEYEETKAAGHGAYLVEKGI